MMKKYFLLLLLGSSTIEYLKAASGKEIISRFDESRFPSIVREGTATKTVFNFLFDGNLNLISENIEFGFASMNNARNSGYSNQDAASIASYNKPHDAPVFIFTVCDGHGNEPKATQIAQSVTTWWPQSLLAKKEALQLDWDNTELYPKTAEEVQLKILKMQGADSAGTTMTSVIFYLDQKKQPQAIFSNVGDSRSLLVRDGKCIYGTKDHKPGDPEEKNRIEKAGGIVIQPDQKREFYRMGNGNQLAVSRTFGDSQDRPFVIEEPTTYKMETVKAGDYFVLATDGFWDIVSNKKIAEKLQEMNDQKVKLQDFVEQVVTDIGLKKSKKNPEGYKQKDDITLLIIKIK